MGRFQVWLVLAHHLEVVQLAHQLQLVVVWVAAYFCAVQLLRGVFGAASALVLRLITVLNPKVQANVVTMLKIANWQQ